MRKPREPLVNWSAINMYDEMSEEFTSKLRPKLEALGLMPEFSEITSAMKEAGRETAVLEGKRHRTHWYDHHAHILDPLAEARDAATKAHMAHPCEETRAAFDDGKI